MADESYRDRISEIPTSWSLIERAHREGTPELPEAQLALILRYQVAIRRYLTACLRDNDAVEEVVQEFALRLLKGDFRRARADRGRFRDYLKTSLIRMMIDYRRRAARHPTITGSEIADSEAGNDAPSGGGDFEENWRTALLDRTWERLERAQRDGGAPLFMVLRFRCERPEATAAELAEILNTQGDGAPYNEAGVRKLLQRAREKFGDLLLDEIAASIESTEPAAIEDELVALRLLPFCRPALEARRKLVAK